MDKLKEKLKQKLAPVRFEHSLRSVEIAVKLAKKHHVSLTQAALGALLHDCAKKKSGDDPLGHALASAKLAKSLFGVKDKAVLSAIAKHTTGSPKMTPLEKTIYLADHLEAGRKYKGLPKIRQVAMKSLDQAIVMVSSDIIAFLLQQKLTIHPATIETRNYYLSKQ